MSELESSDGLVPDGLDRRALIKKAGVAGALAMTAPLIVESVLSPAAAASDVVTPPGGCDPFPGDTENFTGVSTTKGGPGFGEPQDFETYFNGAEISPSGWFVVGGPGANVDACTLPGAYTGAFSGSPAGAAIDLGGTGSTADSGIAKTFSMGCAAQHTFTFDWNNASGANATVTIVSPNGVNESLTLATGNAVALTGQIIFATSVDNDNVTITFMQGDHTNTGAFVTNFSLT